MVVRGLLVAAGLALATPAMAEKLSDDETLSFVESNLIHIFFHETAHALIDQFQLPVVGQEEDAADSFATVEVFTIMEDAEVILLDTAEAMLIMDSWYADDRDVADYFGEHDLDIQRGLRIICHLVGLDPEKYAETADTFDMPDDRKLSCEDDAILADDSWAVLIEPYLLGENEDAVNVDVQVNDDVLTGNRKRLMDEMGLTENFSSYLAESFRWPEPVTLAIDSCGEPNAFYDPAEISITMCVEMIDFLFEVAADY